MDQQEILNLLNKKYPIEFDKIDLLREGPGFVCTVYSGNKRYIIKIYRPSLVERGIQSAEIMAYLTAQGYQVPSIIQTVENEPFFLLDTDEGRRMGVLFSFIEGIDPYLKLDVEKIGKQVGEMHNLMENYKGTLIYQDKPYFIDFYITKLKEMSYPARKIERFAEYGDELWKRVEKFPKSFCHGDLHTGNLVQTPEGEYMVLDFDLACHSFPVFDAMTICDRTDYFNFKEKGYAKVSKMIKRFFTGYTKVCSISDDEIRSIYDFIAIRHYQLQAQIIDVYGLNCIDEAFIDNQYEWLMKWQEQCESGKVLWKV